METISSRGASFRTQLLTMRQAGSFAACLRSNRRFTDVQVCESRRARGEDRWYVSFTPSNTARAEDLLRRQQASREERARQQAFVFAANSHEVYCYSVSSGQTYQLTLDGRTCGCEDSRRVCRPNNLVCKHGLAWLSSDEKREMDAARVQRAEQSRRFEEIFGP